MTKQQRWPEPVYLTKDHAINMTLRDYFAAKAMQGDFIAGIHFDDFADCANRAYKMADAMLKAREK